MKKLKLLFVIIITLFGIALPSFAESNKSTSEKSEKSGNASILSYWEPKLKEILPVGWIISKTEDNAVPYNLSLEKDESPGILFECTGPTIVLGPRGINKEKESFKIWIMSPNYSGKEAKEVGQFQEAKLLGSNKDVSIYIKTFVSDIPSWKSWEKDLIKLFKINS